MFHPAANYMFRVTIETLEQVKLTIKTPGRRHWSHSAVSIVNFEHIYHLVRMVLLLTLSK